MRFSLSNNIFMLLEPSVNVDNRCSKNVIFMEMAITPSSCRLMEVSLIGRKIVVIGGWFSMAADTYTGVQNADILESAYCWQNFKTERYLKLSLSFTESIVIILLGELMY